jgi:hypothetical protein
METLVKLRDNGVLIWFWFNCMFTFLPKRK